jgi:hypothetical protein
MKTTLSLFIILAFLSCTKEEEKCKNYSIVVETNQEEAYAKCNGYGNFYPAFTQELSRTSLGCLKNDELIKAKSQIEKTESTRLCSEAEISIRYRIE